MKEGKGAANVVADIDSASHNTNTGQTDLPVKYSGGELGQIQEILFGTQLRDHNERLSKHVGETEEKIRQLTNNFNRQLEALNERLDGMQENLESQIAEKGKLLANSQSQFTSEISQTKQQLITQITSNYDTTEAQQAKILNELNSHKADMKKAMGQVQDEMLDRMESTVEELRAGKLDTNSLASLLKTMASDLASESQHEDVPDSRAATSGQQ